VLAFVLALGKLVPWINDLVPYHDEVVAGDVMALDQGVTFVPSEGWNIEAGIRVGDETTGGLVPSGATLTNEALSYEVAVSDFDGTAVELVEQIKDTTDALNDAAGLHVVGETLATATAAGVPGAAARFQGTTSDGILVGFVEDGVGVSVVVVGPPDFEGDRSLAEDIAGMIASTSFGEGPA
jgi:hypothetical protein